MSFSIASEKDFTAAFRKVAEEQLQQAIAVLEERPDGADKAVHAFRKNLKRLRTLYRLVAKAVPEFRETENARLRDAAKSLSTIRDAAALIETVRYLQENARGEEEAEALGRIITVLESRRDWLAEAETGIVQKLLETAEILRKATAALDDVSFDDRRRKIARMLARSWHRTVSRATDALAKCHEEGSADTFHDLRKRTQDYRHYLALLRTVWPSAMKAKRDEAKELVDLLGHIHDLDVLSGLVEAEPQLFTRTDDLARLLDAIIARQQDIRGEALVRAQAVFADDAEEESQRIELLWLAVAN